MEKQAQQGSITDRYNPSSHAGNSSQIVTTIRPKEPAQPKFVGPIRSAFSFNVAETSLTRMGIASSEVLSTSSSSGDRSREPSPELPQRVRSSSVIPDVDLMTSITKDEAIRLLGVFENEIACAHPIIETRSLMEKVPKILDFIKNPDQPNTNFQSFDPKDALVLRLAIAIALICETFGKNEVADRIIVSIRSKVGRFAEDFDLQLKDVQVTAMLVSARYSCIERVE